MSSGTDNTARSPACASRAARPSGQRATRRTTPRPLAVLLLLLGFLVVQLPLISPAAAASPGVLTCAPEVATACEAVDACCAPAPQAVAAAQDTCCAPTGVAGDSHGNEPCCPDGCSHCPRPCCSTPLAMIARSDELSLEVASAALCVPQLEEPRAGDFGRVFHPPRS